MANFIPRANAATVAAGTQSNNNRRFNAQLCGVCVITEAEAEAIKKAPASVPTSFREAIQGDVIVLAVDGDGNYTNPRLRLDNTFKENKAFSVTPKFTLVDILNEATNEAGEIAPDAASKFAKELQAKYKAEKATGKKAILAALMAK